MADQFAAAPVNPVISIRPVAVPTPGRDTTNVQTPLAVLPPGTTLEGFVLNRDQTGNPILRTPVGDLQMQSDVFVKTGSQMVIRVDATSETRARIISIDGLPPQDYAAAQTARTGLTRDTVMPPTMAPLPEGAAAATKLPLQQGLPLQQQAALPAGQPSAQLPLQAMLLTPTRAGVAAPTANPLFATIPGANAPIPAALMKLQAGASLKVSILQLELPHQLLSATAPVAGQSPAPTANTPAAAQPHVSQPAPTPQTSPTVGQQPPVTTSPNINAAGMASPQAARQAVGNTVAMPAPVATPTATPQTTPVAHAATPLPAAAPSANPPVITPPNHPNQPHTPGYAKMPGAPVTQQPGSSPVVPMKEVPGGVPALVIGHEADGSNILQTSAGVLKVYTGGPLPMHSKMIVQIVPDPNAPAPLPSLTPSQMLPDTTGDSLLTSLSRDWPALGSAVEQLEAANAPLARELMQSLPQVGDKLASGLLFFIGAVKGGDFKKMIGGRALSALESKLPEVAARMKNDVGQMQQLFLHSPLDQWSSMMLPMMHQGQLEYAKLFLRDEHSEQGDGQGKGKEQRFIVELELSQLGDMQFDGFVRQGGTKKQFDLMIRSARPMDDAMANDIRALFETALQTTGYQGYLGFQNGSHHFVRPLAPTSGSTPKDGQPLLA